MSLRTVFIRLGIAAAGGVLAVGAATSPALAGDDWGDHDSSHDSSHDRYYKGRISAPGGLHLRDKPTRSSAVIGFAEYGEVVSIFCKTPGQSVKGNPLWYLLADGTWAWGAARYIDNIGASPRWC
ncbi:SH3 domain-containing protein [Streptomyces sp. NPDC087844]|uniref:SH3 domain-containing protein n=1 Tax=Streptomyces sp. NPDC087844 TaxID=3365805 RepID=UPI00382E585B